MKFPSLFSLCLITLVLSAVSEDCNSTHFEYFSAYSLGKQDQLNRTFTKLQSTLSVPNMTYIPSQFNKFNITNVNVTVFYLDSSQYSQIVGNNTILIMGGQLEATVNFDWCKYGLSVSQSGTAAARILSKEILFEKKIQIEGGYIDWKLVDAYNVTFQSTNFSIFRISPPDIQPKDEAILLQILNGDIGQKSVKAVIQGQINKDFRLLLAASLKNEHYPLDDHFQYQWQSNYSKEKLLLNYTLVPTGVSLGQDGLSYTFVCRNKDDNHWKCGGSVPTKELNQTVYGGTQQFIEFSVIENTIRYTFQIGVLQTELNRTNWKSRLFQFFVGDLYEVIPALTSKFAADTKVSGYCGHTQSKPPNVYRQSPTSVNVTAEFFCQVYALGDSFAIFTITFESEIQVSASSKHLNFKVKGSSIKHVNYTDCGEYVVQNRELANLMIEYSLKRLTEGYTFGSGWKIYPRDLPQVLVQQDFIVIYDSTH